MKFGYLILYVEDVARSVEFYERAFGLKRLFIHESNDYAEMETGSTKLAFASLTLAEENGLVFDQRTSSAMHSPFEIALVSENVEASFVQAILQGATEIKKPIQKPWGQLVGYVKDLNGVLVEICSPIAAQGGGEK